MRIFAVSILLVVPTLAAAQPFGGVGARAEGMGGAFVAVADDATAVYWNPAGLATGATFDAQVSVAEGSNVFAGMALPVLGLSVHRTHIATGALDRNNEGSGEVTPATLSTTNAGVTVVQTVVSGLVIGSTVRLVTGGIETFESRTTVDVDAGAMWSAGNVRLGVVGRNLTQPEFDAGPVPVALKRQVRIGAALTPRSLPTGVHGPYSLAVDADLTTTPSPEGDLRTASVGGEYWLVRGRIGGRAGVRWSTTGLQRRALSAGLTVGLIKSIFVEGQMTDPEDEPAIWSFCIRVTF